MLRQGFSPIPDFISAKVSDHVPTTIRDEALVRYLLNTLQWSFLPVGNEVLSEVLQLLLCCIRSLSNFSEYCCAGK